jgi:glutathione S-transferase
MDSWKIIQGDIFATIRTAFRILLIEPEIERRYPSPNLHLDDPIVIHVRDAISHLIGPIRRIIIPKVPRNLLQERCSEYYERTRKEKLGMSLSQYEQEVDVEDAWRDAEGPAKEMAQVLKKHGGPFFLGKEVSYADVILVSCLHFLKQVDLKTYERYIALDASFSALYDASKQWLAKED